MAEKLFSLLLIPSVLTSCPRSVSHLICFGQKLDQNVFLFLTKMVELKAEVLKKTEELKRAKALGLPTKPSKSVAKVRQHNA